jgi:uncharacterized protein YecA (UPF0149 family)
VLEFPWQQDDALDEASAGMKPLQPIRVLRKLGRQRNPIQKRKLGRNDPCHCGSGRKYKKCHLPIDEGWGG